MALPSTNGHWADRLNAATHQGPDLVQLTIEPGPDQGRGANSSHSDRPDRASSESGRKRGGQHFRCKWAKWRLNFLQHIKYKLGSNSVIGWRVCPITNLNQSRNHELQWAISSRWRGSRRCRRYWPTYVDEGSTQNHRAADNSQFWYSCEAHCWQQRNRENPRITMQHSAPQVRPLDLRWSHSEDQHHLDRESLEWRVHVHCQQHHHQWKDQHFAVLRVNHCEFKCIQFVDK